MILKTKAMAATGQPGAARQMNWLRSQTGLSEAHSDKRYVALAPEPISPEEFTAREEARNAGKREPGTFVDVKAEEFAKARRGEASPLGEALRAFHKKYGCKRPADE